MIFQHQLHLVIDKQNVCQIVLQTFKHMDHYIIWSLQKLEVLHYLRLVIRAIGGMLVNSVIIPMEQAVINNRDMLLQLLLVIMHITMKNTVFVDWLA